MMPHDVTQADREAATSCELLLCPACFGEDDAVRDCSICSSRGIVADPEAFAARAKAAAAEERARVVAWLLSEEAGWPEIAADIADEIARGDHIQEK